MRYQRSVPYPASDPATLAQLRRRHRTRMAQAFAGGISITGLALWAVLQAARPPEQRNDFATPGVANAPERNAPAPPRLERHDVERLPFEPRVPTEPMATTEPSADADQWQSVKVRAGDTLSKIFARAGLPSLDLAGVLETPEASKRLHNLGVGQELLYQAGKSGLLALRFRVDDFTTLIVERTSQGFKGRLDAIEPEIRTASAVGTITRSLFQDAQSAGIPDSLILDYAELFGWDVDFVRDLRRGDRFKLVFEEIYRNGEKVQTGRILAAEFASVTGKVLRTYWYKHKSGTEGYFSDKGEAMKKAFLLAPLKFTTISSRFNLARRHPILNRIRAHKGVDYAAPMGTAVRAVANGRAEFVGQQPGYGNVIVLKHGDRYSTLYGHLMKFADQLRQGASVTQGQLIGYVGKTGLATGPHLHYEFRIGGEHVDPLTVKLPRSIPLEARYLADFKRSIEGPQAQLSALDNTPTDVSRAVVSRAGESSNQQGRN